MDLGGGQEGKIEVSSSKPESPTELAKRFLEQHGAAAGEDVEAEDVAEVVRDTMRRLNPDPTSSPKSRVPFSSEAQASRAKHASLTLQLVFPNGFEGEVDVPTEGARPATIARKFVREHDKELQSCGLLDAASTSQDRAELEEGVAEFIADSLKQYE